MPGRSPTSRTRSRSRDRAPRHAACAARRCGATGRLGPGRPHPVPALRRASPVRARRFSRAGLSGDPPASIPLGYALRDQVLEPLRDRDPLAPLDAQRGRGRETSGPQRSAPGPKARTHQRVMRPARILALPLLHAPGGNPARRAAAGDQSYVRGGRPTAPDHARNASTTSAAGQAARLRWCRRGRLGRGTSRVTHLGAQAARRSRSRSVSAGCRRLPRGRVRTRSDGQQPRDVLGEPAGSVGLQLDAVASSRSTNEQMLDVAPTIRGSLRFRMFICGAAMWLGRTRAMPTDSETPRRACDARASETPLWSSLTWTLKCDSARPRCYTAPGSEVAPAGTIQR